MSMPHEGEEGNETSSSDTNDLGFYVPKSIDHLSRIFGYNFLRVFHGQEGMEMPQFPTVLIGGLPDGELSYFRGQPDQDYMVDIPSTLSNWAHETPAEYNRGQGNDFSETLFFSSGAKVSPKNEYQFSFKMSDLQT